MKLPNKMVNTLACVGLILAAGVGRAAASDRSARVTAPPAALAAGERCPECRGQPFHPGRLLVRFKPQTTRAGRQAAHKAARAKGVLKDYHVVTGLQLVEVAEDDLSAALSVYAQHPDVLYAEPDYAVHVATVPNDADFALLWGMDNWGQEVYGYAGTPGADIGATQAWDFWTGDPDFTIAVIDTGVNYNHPDLEANIWINDGEIAGNGIDDDGNGYIDDVHGYDFYNEDADPLDEYYHGSHVAGTIGAVANNSLGVAGVNWHCKIVAMKIFGGG